MPEVTVTHPDKVLFPRDGLTKGDVIAYYRTVAGAMVPYLRGHPLAMLRFNQGIDGERFFHKHTPEYFPEFIGRAPVETSKRTTMMPVVQNRDALLYIANHNCIEFHVLPVRADDLWHPDRLIFDLDPSVDDFDAVKEAARWVGGLLEELGLVPFVMTSGSRGLHIWVPLKGSATTQDVGAFVEDVADILVGRHPDVLTTEFSKQDRGDRIYLDVGRNAPGQHAVTPYSLRARDGAPVATPIRWETLHDPELEPTSYRLADVSSWLPAAMDAWRGLRRHARSLTGPMNKLTR